LKEGIDPNVITYNSILYALGSVQQIEEIIQFHNEMKKAGIKSDATTYNMIEVNKFLDQMKQSSWQEKQ